MAAKACADGVVKSVNRWCKNEKENGTKRIAE
jgi:hypothetical protein